MNHPLRSLLISLFLSVGAAPSCAEEAAPPEQLYEVIKVPPGDVLYVRSAPEANAQIVGAIPYDGGSVLIIEPAKPGSSWAKVSHGDIEGYANTAFLAPQQAFSGELPGSLKCTGTEPFWSFSRSGDSATYEPMEGETQTVPMRAALSGANRPNIWALEPTEPNRTPTALIQENRTCSDGMSDTLYRYEIFLRTGDRLLSGCCNATQ